MLKLGQGVVGFKGLSASRVERCTLRRSDKPGTLSTSQQYIFSICVFVIRHKTSEMPK